MEINSVRLDTLFPGITAFGCNAKKGMSERGEWLKHFSDKTGRPLRYIAYRLTGVPTQDFAAFDKQCSTYKGEYSKAFFGALKVRKVIPH